MKFNETPDEARGLLVEALRGGEYTQGKGALEKDGANCCLGVACRIFNKLYPNELTIVKDGSVVRFDSNISFLPSRVQAWLGFSSPRGSCRSGSSLAYLNDHGESFEQIADIIEKGKVNVDA